MCGIFGAIIQASSPLSLNDRVKFARDLFITSERRGKEASGVVTITANSIDIYKIPQSTRVLLSTGGEKMIRDTFSESAYGGFIGHTRLATNGAEGDNANNQPITVGDTVGIHNGIIVNDTDLWKSNPQLKKTTGVDTEVLVALFDSYMYDRSLEITFRDLYSQIYGTASVALLGRQYDAFFLATNNGSLYIYQNSDAGITAFASEQRILEKVTQRFFDNDGVITHLKPNTYALLDFTQRIVSCATFGERTSPLQKVKRQSPRIFRDKSVYEYNTNAYTSTSKQIPHHIETVFERRNDSITKLQRCTKCILPETFPLITYNNEGVCNYCTFYTPLAQRKGVDSLRTQIPRTGAVSPSGADLVMGFSGGRDSCYGLHYIKKEMELTPVAYTYDWGVITDLGRRNQSRLCAQLGVEHVIVSANIREKRENIRKNILAWLRKPDLGLIPLFMAGDKQYFYHLNELAKDLNISSMLMCENPLERTFFKHGFCGITHEDNSIPPYNTSTSDKLRVALYYGTQFLSNPKYINSSLIDTFGAYISYYLIQHSYLYLFDHITWDENVVNKTLIEEYDWELAPDTKSTWRIGDGTAPFYNYIYYTVAGFTENDTLRSNQIREGHVTRDEALTLATRDNQPRWESLLWYLHTVGLPVAETLDCIHNMKPLWEKAH